jgi:hypothetical protein
MARRECPLCKEPLEDPPAIHDPIKCEHDELIKARVETKQLKQSVSDWKDAWYHQREIFGRIWWHHPAINNDVERSYYQTSQASIVVQDTSSPFLMWLLSLLFLASCKWPRVRHISSRLQRLLLCVIYSLDNKQ